MVGGSLRGLGGFLGLILGALAVAHFRGPCSFKVLGVTGEALGLIWKPLGNHWVHSGTPKA